MGYYVVATSKRAVVRPVVALEDKPGKYTVAPLGRRCAEKLTRLQAREALAWAQGKGFEVRVTKYRDRRFLSRSPDTQWPTNKALMRRLNEVGRRTRSRVHVTSGWRTPRKCWELRMAYIQGWGNTAARCCSKYDWCVHSWDDCGKDPWSNHASGDAADCGIITRKGYVSIGYVARARRWMRRVHLCLPVGPTAANPKGEFWHVQVGDEWNVVL